MPEEMVAEPKPEVTPIEKEKKLDSMSPNMHFKNKYAVGDKVWAVFTNGPVIRVNQFEVKSFNAEVIGLDEPSYIYGFTISHDGHDDAVNMTFLPENLCHFDRTKAEEKARGMVGEVVAEFEKQIETETRKFEDIIGTLNEQKALITANDLTVPERVAVAPPQEPEKVPEEYGAENTDPQEPAEEPKADPVTPEPTPDNEQPNPESDVEVNTSKEEA